MSETLRAAGRMKGAGVPFFWLPTYEGGGGIGAWPPEEQAEFWDSGARFVPVHRMVESLTYLTKVCFFAVFLLFLSLFVLAIIDYFVACLLFHHN